VDSWAIIFLLQWRTLKIAMTFTLCNNYPFPYVTTIPFLVWQLSLSLCDCYHFSLCDN
jgi:hypothetical protein